MTMTRTKFDDWKAEVDAHLISLCGMPSDCIDDFDYRSAFDCGESPKDVAQDAFDNAFNY